MNDEQLNMRLTELERHTGIEALKMRVAELEKLAGTPQKEPELLPTAGESDKPKPNNVLPTDTSHNVR